MKVRFSILGPVLIAAISCGGGTPTGPTTTTTTTTSTTTTTTAPVVANTPPTIASFVVQGTRVNEPPNFADVSEDLPVVAFVSDPETAVGDLTFNWSSSVGTFIGSGPIVTWRAPASVDAATNVALNLEVVETYTSAGKNVENRVTGSATVSLHDSIREVGDMARQFLLDFSDSTLSVTQVMRNFQPDCYGTGEETGQVGDNRQNFRIIQSRVEPASTSVRFGGFCPFRDKRGDACAQVRTFWKSIALNNQAGFNTGDTTNASGVDQVAAMYIYRDQKRWRLCDSQFNGDNPSQTSLKAQAKGLVP